METEGFESKFKVVASEKIHGTNGGVGFFDGEIWAQSRNNVLTLASDNAGFAFFVKSNLSYFSKIFKQLIEEYGIDKEKYILTLFGEWSGGNIQKRSALTGVEKSLLLFQHFKLTPIDKQLRKEGTKWKELKVKSDWLHNDERRIFNIMNFKTYSFDIDFKNPSLSVNNMIELVDSIEENSPVGNQFGQDNNIAEGIVCTVFIKDNLLRWKVKGEKHSVSKVKTLSPVDDFKESKKIDFANSVCKPWRLEQMWQSLFGIEEEKLDPSVKHTGDFIRLVLADIYKEESENLFELGLEPRDVNGKIADISRKWFLDQLNSLPN